MRFSEEIREVLPGEEVVLPGRGRGRERSPVSRGPPGGPLGTFLEAAAGRPHGGVLGGQRPHRADASEVRKLRPADSRVHGTSAAPPDTPPTPELKAAASRIGARRVLPGSHGHRCPAGAGSGLRAGARRSPGHDLTGGAPPPRPQGNFAATRDPGLSARSLDFVVAAGPAPECRPRRSNPTNRLVPPNGATPWSGPYPRGATRGTNRTSRAQLGRDRAAGIPRDGWPRGSWPFRHLPGPKRNGNRPDGGAGGQSSGDFGPASPALRSPLPDRLHRLS